MGVVVDLEFRFYFSGIFVDFVPIESGGVVVLDFVDVDEI